MKVIASYQKTLLMALVQLINLLLKKKWWYLYNMKQSFDLLIFQLYQRNPFALKNNQTPHRALKLILGKVKFPVRSQKVRSLKMSMFLVDIRSPPRSGNFAAPKVIWTYSKSNLKPCFELSIWPKQTLSKTSCSWNYRQFFSQLLSCSIRFVCEKVKFVVHLSWSF